MNNGINHMTFSLSTQTHWLMVSVPQLAKTNSSLQYFESKKKSWRWVLISLVEKRKKFLSGVQFYGNDA